MYTRSGKLQENSQVNNAFASVTQCRKTTGEHYVFMALIVTSYQWIITRKHHDQSSGENEGKRSGKRAVYWPYTEQENRL